MISCVESHAWSSWSEKFLVDGLIKPDFLMMIFCELNAKQTDHSIYVQCVAWSNISSQRGNITMPVIVRITFDPLKPPRDAGLGKCRLAVRTPLQTWPQSTSSVARKLALDRTLGRWLHVVPSALAGDYLDIISPTLDPRHTIKDMFTSWEYTVSWYRTPERVLWLLEAAPKRKEDSGDLLSPGQQTGCQKTESDTSGRSACTRLCTKVPRCNSWSIADLQKTHGECAR